MKTSSPNQKKPRGSEELIQNLDALDRAQAILHRIEAQCAVLQAAATSPNAAEISPDAWSETLAIICDDAAHLRGELEEIFPLRRH